MHMGCIKLCFCFLNCAFPFFFPHWLLKNSAKSVFDDTTFTNLPDLSGLSLP